MIFADRLRPPAPGEALAPIAKDWLHLNLFDPRSDVAVVINASLHGRSGERPGVASATALIRAHGEWTTTHRVVGGTEAPTTDRSISVGDVLSMRLDPVTGGLDVVFEDRLAEVTLVVAATPMVDAIESAPFTFGSGWIGWRAVPLLSVTGRLTDGRGTIGLDDALAYHDHNWGRWRWGEDIGWVWAAWPSHDGAIVISKATDRAHRSGAARAVLALPTNGRWASRSYGAASVVLDADRWRSGCNRRIPGAMAALHGGRTKPRLPTRLELRVDDGFDRFRARFEADDVTQVIVAEPAAAGYSFIHEITGRFRAEGTSDGRPFAAEGEGVFEHVD